MIDEDLDIYTDPDYFGQPFTVKGQPLNGIFTPLGRDEEGVEGYHPSLEVQTAQLPAGTQQGDPVVDETTGRVYAVARLLPDATNSMTVLDLTYVSG